MNSKSDAPCFNLLVVLLASSLLVTAVVAIPADCMGSVTWNNPSSDVPGTWFPYVGQGTNVDDRALANM